MEKMPQWLPFLGPFEHPKHVVIGVYPLSLSPTSEFGLQAPELGNRQESAQRFAGETILGDPGRSALSPERQVKLIGDTQGYSGHVCTVIR
jgi:hypothetical protein